MWEIAFTGTTNQLNSCSTETAGYHAGYHSSVSGCTWNPNKVLLAVRERRH